jgi:RHS repeat-associated protein
VERYTYTPYGVATVRYGNDDAGTDWSVRAATAYANTLLYTGKAISWNTLLQYNNARYYDAALERFINRDPVGYLGGKNLYRYCVNDPATSTDPAGLTRYRGQDPTITRDQFARYYIEFLRNVCNQYVSPEQELDIKMMLNQGCIGVVSTLLGLWPGYSRNLMNGLSSPRPDVSRCYRNYQDAVAARKVTDCCDGMNVYGLPREPRIFQLQFSTDGDNIDLEKSKQNANPPYYDLSSDDVWSAIYSVGPNGKDNFDYAIEILGMWYHANTGGKDMEIYRSTTVDMELDWSDRSSTKNGKPIFDQRFFCVACDAKRPWQWR